ncbi:IclR family transcriptional regulator [Actinomycetospora corticicola]|uniref:DNA-binding IclR family transcriptional regulator n=1 Tax=Actinomycetospora corticicola TaxID=663602 RepID=A0A7Y9DXK3_9PSEU|nr:IclR family transcriptional regulator [Actinomycetospora corticicola]NYD37393.1 DNA-binding IclR family transcriptional regulator [Actinomycetospora corticicola]
MVPATVLGKALTVLQAFTVEDTELGFAELGRRTGLAKATLHRTLAELLEHRLLERPDGRYRLSGLVFELGMRAAVGRSLLEVAAPYLEDLFVRTRETVHLGVREGTEVVYVAKSGGHRQVDAPSRLGGRMPLHATAIGKVLLAHAPPDVRETVLRGRPARLTPRTVVNVEVLRRQLDRVHERGVALEHEESAVGVTCVAAVVADREGGAHAAVSVTGPVHRFDPERHLDAVRAAGAGIASMLARGRSG